MHILVESQPGCVVLQVADDVLPFLNDILGAVAEPSGALSVIQIRYPKESGDSSKWTSWKTDLRLRSSTPTAKGIR